MRTLAQTVVALLTWTAHATSQAVTDVTGTLVQPTSGNPTITTVSLRNPSDLPPPPSQTGCPTVTETRELCSTCPVPACLGLFTVTQSCGCPTPVPTVYLDFPCSQSCSSIGCSTSYDIVTATDLTVCTGSSSTLPSTSQPRNVTSTTRIPTGRPTTSPPATAAGARVKPFRLWM